MIRAELVLRGFALFAMVALLGSGAPSSALDIELITNTAGAYREDGVFIDYFMSFTVEGSGISGGSVSKAGAPPTHLCDLVFAGPGFVSPESWSCELEDFASLDEICQVVGFGDFLFEVTELAGPGDSATLFFDPGCSDPFSGYLVITDPAPGGVVPPLPGADDFCWTCSAVGTCGPGNFAPAIADPSTGDLGNELLRESPIPTCWEPAVCIPQGVDYEFSVTSLEFQADLEPRQTDSGDPFDYVSAFESANATLFDVNQAPPPTPPAVPKGRGATNPLRAGKLTPDGGSIEILWDAESCCSAADHHLVWGRSSDLPASPGSSFGVAGSECELGISGTFEWNNSPSVTASDLVWWFVLASDGVNIEGSWGLDATDAERSGPGADGSSTACGFGMRDLANSCGR